MKRIIILGATSGIGFHVAQIFIHQGWMVGVCGRREEKLSPLVQLSPGSVFSAQIDITGTNATTELEQLITKMGGVDVYLHCAGIGSQNASLDNAIEQKTVMTNVIGFTQMIDFMFNYFAQQGHGHIAAITSIAGFRALGLSASYSATKRYQSHYLSALSQLAHIRKLSIQFTDIKPGFVRTDLLKHNYPMIMDPEKVARIIYKSIIRKRRRVVIDWKYALLVRFMYIIPDFIWERLPLKTKDANIN